MLQTSIPRLRDNGVVEDLDLVQDKASTACPIHHHPVGSLLVKASPLVALVPGTIMAASHLDHRALLAHLARA